MVHDSSCDEKGYVVLHKCSKSRKAVWPDMSLFEIQPKEKLYDVTLIGVLQRLFSWGQWQRNFVNSTSCRLPLVSFDFEGFSLLLLQITVYLLSTLNCTLEGTSTESIIFSGCRATLAISSGCRLKAVSCTLSRCFTDSLQNLTTLPFVFTNIYLVLWYF